MAEQSFVADVSVNTGKFFKRASCFVLIKED